MSKFFFKTGRLWTSQCRSIHHHVVRVPKVCIVGSGPAGFYLTQTLMNKGPSNMTVDILEKYPTPFGLVRFGVAPDHPEVKNVDHTFTKVARNERVNFIGNVSLGQDISLNELRKHYDAVVLAYGAAKDRKLNIPGEDLNQVWSARRFVGLYNGLPDDQDLQMNLDCANAVVVGMGNVALDVARILLTPIDTLKKTDITESALELLSKSRIEKVYIVGRRGPLHVAFTIRELREMIKLPKCRPILDPNDFVGIKDIVKSFSRPRKRLTELLLKSCEESVAGKFQEAEKSWYLKLLRTPLQITGDERNRVKALELGINRLIGSFLTEDQLIEPSGETESLDCGILFRSIGYQSVRVDPEIPFDLKNGRVPNVDGKVENEMGLYCTGWLATGPRGVIVDTMNEAYKVGQTILHDIQNDQIPMCDTKNGLTGLRQTLKNKNVKFVTFEDWQEIDSVEKKRGEQFGKVREKITDVDAQISLVNKEHS